MVCFRSPVSVYIKLDISADTWSGQMREIDGSIGGILQENKTAAQRFTSINRMVFAYQPFRYCLWLCLINAPKMHIRQRDKDVTESSLSLRIVFVTIPLSAIYKGWRLAQAKWYVGIPYQGHI